MIIVSQNRSTCISKMEATNNSERLFFNRLTKRLAKIFFRPLNLDSCAHICPRQPAGELGGDLGVSGSALVLCCSGAAQSSTRVAPLSGAGESIILPWVIAQDPRYWLRLSRDTQDWNWGMKISIAANVQNLFFSVLVLKSSIIRKWAPLGNVSRRMSDVFDFRGRVEKTETCQRKESFRRWLKRNTSRVVDP